MMGQQPYDWQAAGDWEQTPASSEPRWWSIRKDSAPATPAEPEPAQPGVQVTIQPTAPPAPTSDRKARIRWWVLRRGTAGALGYYLTGLGPVTQHQLTDAGPGAVGFALLLWLVTWYGATKALLLVPRAAVEEVHLAADWAAHIPSATVLVALALHAPGAAL
ncbi:hypothetical protein ABZ135_22135 [Streptomyces sp. NPDC006339]|uniref:hypothetical protein n=1 Tax=Streptomyces sp. NPDC006339 TaxID=3156755 RepID=UPI0033BDD776